jgi:Tfp pilus assembly protein PilW
VSRPNLRSEESGMTLVELVVATAAGAVIFLGLTTMIIASMHQTRRTTNHVHATQEARLTVQRIVGELHSACVAADATPIQTNSSGTSIAYVYQTGSAAALTPVLHQVSLNGSTLSLTTYPVTSGSTPRWTFSETATSTQTLMTEVSPVTAGGPIFTYYAYNGGSISTTPLAVPLSSTNAAKAVQVNVALKVGTDTATVADPRGPGIIQNSAYLRYGPPAANVNVVNLPCE